MLSDYVLIKFLHIFVAIVALGTSAGLGIILEFYGDHPAHGAFILRIVERMAAYLVVPGYMLMLLTGLWMVHLSWPLTPWIRSALALWGVGMVMLRVSVAILRKQRRLFDRDGPASASYRRVAWFERGTGGAAGLVVVMILYLMVFKPGS
ncbi:MAG TPA: DUF2269 family protein [Mariprofundaceae bacterium]|nr:DUF2269 family protein [Mariprofundaceae bacterium]